MGLVHSKPPSVKPSVVIAIDFGTSYIGYAFAFQHKEHEILLNDYWGREVGAEFYKTPTSVLYDEKGNFDSFGFLAQKNYFEMLNKGHQRPSYFTQFKMELYGKQKLGPDLQIVGEGGCKRAALDIFADALGFIRKKALDEVINRNRRLPYDIRWVVTVPAVWNEEQKKFMKEACVKAGLLQMDSQEDFVLALESESALLYCTELTWDKFSAFDRHISPSLKKGTVNMVVDLGGDTFEVTVHKLIGEEMIEVIAPQGCKHCGNDVNREFEILLNKILGQDFLDHLNKTMPEILPRMMLNFEKAKRTFEERNPVHIPLYYGLAECYKNYTGKNIRDILKGDSVIKGETMKDFFVKVVDIIYTVIHDAVNACPEGSKPSYIYLVGGFAESKYVQKKLKTLEYVFNKSFKLRLLFPYEANVCVLKGAVKFGQNYKHANSYSRVTCALLLQREFRKGIDNEDRKFKSGDHDMIEYLQPILQKGEPVWEGLRKSEPIFMGYEGKDMHIIVYSSDAKTIESPNAGNVNEFGSIVIKGNGQTTMTNKQVTLQIIFGKIEFELRVIDSGEEKILCNMEFK